MNQTSNVPLLILMAITLIPLVRWAMIGTERMTPLVYNRAPVLGMLRSGAVIWICVAVHMLLRSLVPADAMHHFDGVVKLLGMGLLFGNLAFIWYVCRYFWVRGRHLFAGQQASKVP
jgi:hypothetical protein